MVIHRLNERNDRMGITIFISNHQQTSYYVVPFGLTLPKNHIILDAG